MSAGTPITFSPLAGCKRLPEGDSSRHHRCWGWSGGAWITTLADLPVSLGELLATVSAMRDVYDDRMRRLQERHLADEIGIDEFRVEVPPLRHSR